MKKIFFIVKLFFIGAFIFSLTSCEEMINAMLNSDSPTVTMSQGTHTNSIDISWTAPSKKDITILSYNIRYGTSEFALGTATNVGLATTYSIPASNATYYYAEVQAIYRDDITNKEETSNWSSTAKGFAMDSTKLTWLSYSTQWNLPSSIENWFTTMMQKGYTYTFIGISNTTEIEIYKEGDISSPVKTLSTSGTAISWTCNETGNYGKFYFKVKRGSVTSMYVSFSNK